MRTCFSIHAPTRGATDAKYWQSVREQFQSTRPHGARRLIFGGQTSSGGFNPRAHTGRDTIEGKAEHLDAVSIHAPTRGATRYGGG